MSADAPSGSRDGAGPAGGDDRAGAPADAGTGPPADDRTAASGARGARPAGADGGVRLRLRDRVVDLASDRPALMGVVNCSPNSFSDAARPGDAAERAALGRALLADGAALVDVGGESGVTYDGVLDAAAEIERVLPVVRGLLADGAIVSVDTWKAAVADAVLAAGAHLINDVSGLHDPDLADVVARHRAGLVVMHTRAAPKTDHYPGYGGDVAGDVVGRLAELRDRALGAGVPADGLLLDPGPDFAKLPHETVEALRALPRVAALGHPVLLAISRKYFHGVITGTPPHDRLPGTLAALVAGGELAGPSIARVHDVRACREHLDVRDALRGRRAVPRPDLADERLRWLRPA